MSTLLKHAKRELEILQQTTPDSLVLPFTKDILSICESFDKSGQSGGSALYTARAITRTLQSLLSYEAVSPLTGEYYEWVNVSDFFNNESVFQNKRDSRVFKHGVNGRAYFLEAIVFEGDITKRFTSRNSVSINGKSINSSQYIKSFPFIPKTFYIDVVDYRWKDKEETIFDEQGDWWTHEIKHEAQLAEVFDYYDFKE